MQSRLNLQTKLEDILGSRNVYYQPPENLKIDYPAIIYNKSDIHKINGDNIPYNDMVRYTIIVVDQVPDNKAIFEILRLPYASYNRHYKVDNLNHDVLNLYF